MFVLSWEWCANKKSKDQWARIKRPRTFRWRLEGIVVDENAGTVSLRLKGQPGKLVTLLEAGHKDCLSDSALDGE